MRAFKRSCKFLSCENEADFLFYVCPSSANVLFKSLLEESYAVWSIMEIWNNLVQSICRIVVKQVLKITERKGAIVELLGMLDKVVAIVVRYEQDKTPIVTFFIKVIALSVPSLYDVQRFPLGIAACLDYLLAKKGRYACVIFHKSRDIFKNVLIYLLKNVFLALAVALNEHVPGIIYMTVSVRMRLDHHSVYFKLTDEPFYVFTCPRNFVLHTEWRTSYNSFATHDFAKIFFITLYCNPLTISRQNSIINL